MIGIFGGTFDPVHYGHLRAIVEVREIFSLDQVRLVPNKIPPHRGVPSASTEARLAMLRLAVEGVPQAVVDTRELDRAGPSYMVDTLSSLRCELNEQPLLLFIGVDAYNGLTEWHRWTDLFEYAHLVVLTRPGHPVRLRHDHLACREAGSPEELKKNAAGKLWFQSITPLDISASAIREMVSVRRDPRFLLPDNVLGYITRHQLYQNA